MTNKYEKINYIEFPSTNLLATKDFFTQVFGWSFRDFGEKYCAFSTPEIAGGFFQSTSSSLTKNGASLVVFYSENLARTQAKIEKTNGVINQPIFSFPGGRRFHFIEPGGNEFGVWSEH